MREMQDRLTELRGMTARAYPYPPRPGEIGQTHPQSHPSFGLVPPGACWCRGLMLMPCTDPVFFAVAPVAGNPWAAWFPPPPTSFNATPYSATPFGGTPFNATPYTSVPYIPSPQPPFVPPEPIMREFGASNMPRFGAPKGSEKHDSSLGSSNHPGKTSSPVVVTLTPPVPKSVPDSEPASSQAQAASNGTFVCVCCIKRYLTSCTFDPCQCTIII